MDSLMEKSLQRPLQEVHTGGGVVLGAAMVPPWTELLASAGHDLRAPVATIVHYVDSEEAAGRLDKAQARVIQAQATRLLTALDTLMERLHNGTAAVPRMQPRAPLPCPVDAAPADEVGGPCVWVVEDCDYAAAALIQLLRDAHCRVLCLADGQALVGRLQAADCARPGLVVTDFHMPGLGGAEVLRAVRARWPGLPVVCMTARDDVAALAACGFAAVLPKPVKAARLRQVLAALLPPAVGRAQPAPPSLPALPPAELAELQTLARLGAVSDLLDRCAQLGTAHAAWQPFLSRLSALAGQGDFAGCMELLRA